MLAIDAFHAGSEAYNLIEATNISFQASERHAYLGLLPLVTYPKYHFNL